MRCAVFALFKEQIAVRDRAREGSEEKIAPYVLCWHEEKQFPTGVMREMAGRDIGGSHIRVDVGGSAMMMRADAALILEGVD